MPTPNLLNRLSVYGSMIENVCVVLRDHGELRADVLTSYVLTCPEDASIEAELLPYMLDVGLIEMRAATNADNFPTYSLDSTYVVGWSPRLNLLHRLRKIEGVNTMILGLHAYLLRHDEYASRWLDYKQVYPTYNRDEVGRSSGDVAYNENKMRSWLRVMSYIGLIQPERSNSFVLAPRLDLVQELLHTAELAVNYDSELPLAQGVELLQAEFCQVTSNPGRMHQGFSDALLLLQEKGFVELAALGDAEMISLAEGGRFSHARILGWRQE